MGGQKKCRVRGTAIKQQKRGTTMEQEVVSGGSSTTEADEALYGHVINALRYLTSARQEVTDLYEFEQAKYDGYTQKGRAQNTGKNRNEKLKALNGRVLK